MEEEALQSSAKLHGLCGSMTNGVIIDPPEGQVHNKVRASLPLRNNPQRGETETGQVFYQIIREDSPEAFLDKVGHFVVNKVSVVDRQTYVVHETVDREGGPQTSWGPKPWLWLQYGEDHPVGRRPYDGDD